MATITLKRTGQKVGFILYGLWKVTKSSTADTVYKAIQAGYRLLDGAGDYGNEKEAGEGVRRAIADGLVKREDIFITSKLWNTYHKREHVKQYAKFQLELWGIDYFDLFLIHFPISLKYVDKSERYPPEWYYDPVNQKVELQNTPYRETWEAMEELVDAGLVKNIGVRLVLVSNVASVLLRDVHTYARYEPQVLQIEHHPYLTQEPLVHYAKDVLGMAITAYTSLGPQSFVELNADKGAASLLTHGKISQIAQAHGRTTAQVLLRWATQRGIAVIPKTNNATRLVQNFAVNDFDLSEEEIKSISALNSGLRFNDPQEINPKLAIFA
ncbi:NADP-dependent oxidoreductase domain-containing protein [Hysterangium stoloniferum]|nr:NADP-dependent oxidoreductase domain-containing protein [Hysterangium stoloniferum]